MDTPSDYLVVDAMVRTPDTGFSAIDVSRLKEKHGTVLAYVSIGEAEDFRGYFKAEWKKTPPAWLGKANPDWEGAVKVRYWDPDWQAIVLSAIRQAAESGFDGAYLDIVDGYEYWSDSENGEVEVLEKDDAALKMIAFIKEIRSEAKAINPGFLIFPQNAPELVPYPGYLEAIDGIGKEDTWYEGYSEIISPGSKSKPLPQEDTDTVVNFLRQIKDAGKTALVVDYFDPSQVEYARDFEQKARQDGFIPYAADRRALDSVSTFYGEKVSTEKRSLPPSWESETFDASRLCVKTCQEAKTKGQDLTSGPCLSNKIIDQWVCDVAHKPRLDVDNLDKNTCPEFGKSADHFVEVDEECDVIDVQ